jgi:hypothetical protein
LIDRFDYDLLDVILFLKTNSNTKFNQLIDITAVDYPERDLRFKIFYFFKRKKKKKLMKQLNFNNLMKLNLHLGHFQNGSLITPYLFGRRFKRYIFNLEKSITILRRCLLLIEQISKKKGEI